MNDDWLSDPVRPWPRLLRFAIPLREPVPIGHGSTFSRLLEGDVPELQGRRLTVTPDGPELPAAGSMFVSLYVWQLRADADRTDRKLLDAAFTILGVKGSAHDVTESADYRTIIEAVTVARRADSGPDPLTRCLDVLFEMVRAYRLADSVRIPELTYERVLPLVPYQWWTLDDQANRTTGMIRLEHGNVITPGPPVWGEDDLERYTMCLERLIKGDPFLLYAERRLEAQRALHQDGQYAESAIQAAIASEVLLDGVLSMLLWEEALPDGAVEAGADVFSIDTAKRVRSSYHPRLGGRWMLTGDEPVALWYAVTAGLRNRVVHRGYRPAKSESDASIKTLYGLEAYVCDRVAERSRQFPRTALTLLGGSGLSRRGLWRDELFGDGAIGRVPDLVQRYAAWRQRLDAAVSVRRRGG